MYQPQTFERWIYLHTFEQNLDVEKTNKHCYCWNSIVDNWTWIKCHPSSCYLSIPTKQKDVSLICRKWPYTPARLIKKNSSDLDKYNLIYTSTWSTLRVPAWLPCSVCVRLPCSVCVIAMQCVRAHEQS